MEKTPMVSIIMPVYKVEDYLPRAIRSVLSQTFTDFELILVDDESPDGSGKLCDEAAARDARIRVIHQKNGGSASARNAGIALARGKYYFFPDSDDWFEPDMLKVMVDAAESTQSTLTMTGFCMEYFENGKARAYNVSPEAAYYSQEDFRKNAYRYFDQSYLAFPWNKLYLAEPIRVKHIRYPETYRQWNDLPFNVEYVKDVESVSVVPGSFYHYFRSRPGAEGAVVSEGNILYGVRKNQFESILSLYDYWKLDDARSVSGIHAYYVTRLLQCVSETASQRRLPAEKRRAQIREILDDAQTRESLTLAKPQSALMRLAILPMKLHAVRLCYWEGLVIGLVKEKLSGFFLDLRCRVVNHGKQRAQVEITEDIAREE